MQHMREALRELGAGDRILFHYSGPCTQDLIHAGGDIVRRRMSTRGVAQSIQRKLFSAFVELAQNVMHYANVPAGLPAEGPERCGSIWVGRDDAHFFVLCANPVTEAAVPALRTQLERLRDMDGAAIRAAYRERMHSEPAEGSKGATLGLLTLARDASAPLEYAFERNDAGTTTLCLRVMI